MIIISPFAKQLRNGNKHPKNYPWWSEVIDSIEEEIIQVGTENETQLVSDFRKNLSINEMSKLISECKTWISVDSFMQHLGWYNKKYGIAIFAQSDPNIFGHSENVNLLKDRKYLREKQFWLWEQCEYNEDAFVKPQVVLEELKKFNVRLK